MRMRPRPKSVWQTRQNVSVSTTHRDSSDGEVRGNEPSAQSGAINVVTHSCVSSRDSQVWELANADANANMSSAVIFSS